MGVGRAGDRYQVLLAGMDGSGGRGDRLTAGGARPVQQHRCGGGEQRGSDGDQGDLPAGHAADDDGADLDRLY